MLLARLSLHCVLSFITGCYITCYTEFDTSVFCPYSRLELASAGDRSSECAVFFSTVINFFALTQFSVSSFVGRIA